MDIAKILVELSAQLGVGPLQLDYADACALRFDNIVHVDLQYDRQADTIFLCADVGPLDDGDKPDTLRMLLLANLTRENIGDAYFALSPGGHAVVLCRALQGHDLDALGVFSELETVVIAARVWRQRLAQHPHATA